MTVAAGGSLPLGDLGRDSGGIRTRGHTHDRLSDISENIDGGLRMCEGTNGLYCKDGIYVVASESEMSPASCLLSCPPLTALTT